MLEDIKKILRITSDAFDTEVSDLILSAKDDLRLVGVLQSKIDMAEPDSLIKRAVIFYCKANFGLDNADSEKYQIAYEALKTHLTLSQEYTVEAVTG
jgi:uncharacterized phage protein (predicted DNA packaging)